MKKNLVWFILGIAVITAIAAVVMQSTSTRVLYASQMGCKLDSDVYNGGGTDDSSALQTAINLATVKGYMFIVDGPALVSTNINLPSNTKLKFLPGAGFFMAPHANCWVLGNQQNTNYSSTNIWIEGGILNCNGNNQAEYVTNGFQNSGAPGVWGVWFAGVDGLTMRDVTILSSKTYATLFNDSRNILCENITYRWTNNVAATNTYYGTDSLHAQCNITNLHFNGLTSISGHDDVVALMTDETSLTLNVLDPRWTINSGAMKDILIENVYLSRGTGGVASAPRTFSKFQTQGGTNAILENVTIRNVYGNVQLQGLVVLAPTDGYLKAKNLRINGFHVTFGTTFDSQNTSPIGLSVLTADTVYINDVGIDDTGGTGIGRGYIEIGPRTTNALISNVYVQGSANSIGGGDTAVKVLADPYQDGQVNTNAPRVSLDNVTAKSMAAVITDDGLGVGVIKLGNIQRIATPSMNLGVFTNIFILPTNTPSASGMAIASTSTTGETTWTAYGAPTITYTNFISGLRYVNGARPISIYAACSFTAAQVAGSSTMALFVDATGGTTWSKTNRVTIGTTVTTIADTYVFQLTGFVPASASYILTNLSTGAGNSASTISSLDSPNFITY